ncbi:AraC family transcriptional regulator [Ruminococcus sp.]|uniref:AraC family transcriptional regulator n=1 Tax=Ruminococcus sp. TaxID=41978 RepID=UPI0025D60057|nr:AraC family transcriptional regulator [Ruminococcus sp.]MCR4637833.1 AraC family transcriptional regulator [Ruminococcus sp.]
MEQPEKKFTNKLSKRIISTPTPAAKNAFFYIQEAGCTMKEDAYTVNRRKLDLFLIGAVVSGRGELTVDDDTISLVKGDCFFIDCRKIHSYKSSNSEPWELMWVHFNGSTSQQYHDFFSSNSKHTFRPPFFDRVVSDISKIIELHEKNDQNAELYTSKYIVDLLTISLTFNNSEQQYDSALKQKLAAVNRYIDDHFTEDISLEKLSSEFYISKYYLTREYKHIYGKTIFQHIITARINYGKKLLRFSDKSVEEIAHLCGFNDQSYFARQFKRSENLTCFSYRKMWRD